MRFRQRKDAEMSLSRAPDPLMCGPSLNNNQKEVSYVHGHATTCSGKDGHGLTTVEMHSYFFHSCNNPSRGISWRRIIDFWGSAANNRFQ